VGGTKNAGTVFRMTRGGRVRVLHTFSGTDGRLPSQLAEAPDGRLYGVTLFGGGSNVGTVCRVTTAGSFTLLHSFEHDPGYPCLPSAPTQGADGNLYGTTLNCGAFNQGSVYSITPQGDFTTRYSFDHRAGPS